jgi:uncharacterized damage-inducible protein DinB
MKRDAWLKTYDEEMSLTRRCLERVPEERFDWRPHPKSPTLGWLANFCAQLISWTRMTLETDGLDFGDPANPKRPEELGTRAAVLKSFDRNVTEGRAALAAATDERLAANWTLRNGEQVMVSSPREDVLRRWVLHHAIHHRAQLGVYLRLLDVPVPAIYGPSADEVGW